MSEENVELAKILLPQPGTDIVSLIRDEDTYARMADAKLIDVGEHVVVLLRNHGRRENMETEVELIGATILTFREGKLARWGDYAERAAAFEAVGLSEQDTHADS
jgi:hypothetical protein